jgi:hypothetical protein
MLEGVQSLAATGAKAMGLTGRLESFEQISSSSIPD